MVTLIFGFCTLAGYTLARVMGAVPALVLVSAMAAMSWLL